MNKELRDLLEKIETYKAQAKDLANNKRISEAKDMIKDINDLKEEYEVKKELFENKKGEVKMNKEINKEVKNLEIVAFKRALLGKSLTMEMQDALQSGVDENGGLLIPNDEKTAINMAKREYKSMKALVGVEVVTTNAGTRVYEDTSTITALTNFSENAELTAVEPKFKQIAFAVENYGAICPIPNTLLQDETAGLPAYIHQWFAKKAVRTENKDIFDAIAAAKASDLKVFKDIDAVKKSLIVDVDPMLGMDLVIVTNQNGFAYLDALLDTNKRPLLQPDPTNATRKMLAGVPIEVFSNAELADDQEKGHPIIFGDLVEAVKFYDRNVYEVASSADALFTKNQTVLRVVERFDVVVADKDAVVMGHLKA